MKAVLLSIKPKWCELIANGKKTVEVRKTKPNIETPFKVYIYATKPKTNFDLGLCIDREWRINRIGVVHKINYETAKNYNIEILSGKIIGEFVCDKIEQGHILWVKDQPEYYDKKEEKTQLTYRQMFDYLGENGVGYFWYISNLVIYEKPRGLSEFATVCDGLTPSKCDKCRYSYKENTESGSYEECMCDGLKPLERPPQSWCYCEEAKNE